MLTPHIPVLAAADTKFADIGVSAWVWIGFVALLAGLLTIDLMLHRDNHTPSAKRALVESATWVACGLSFRSSYSSRGAVGVRRVPQRVRHREVAQHRQRLRLGDHLLDLRDPGPVPAPSALLGRLRTLTLHTVFVLGGAPASSPGSRGCCRVRCRVARLRHQGDPPPRRRGHAGARPHGQAPRSLRTGPRDAFGQRFLLREGGKSVATPSRPTTLVVIEVTDVVFTVDSVPAILAVPASRAVHRVHVERITILGLRAMYFLLGNAHERFHYLSHHARGHPHLRGREDGRLALVPHAHHAVAGGDPRDSRGGDPAERAPAKDYADTRTTSSVGRRIVGFSVCHWIGSVTRSIVAVCCSSWVSTISASSAPVQHRCTRARPRPNVNGRMSSRVTRNSSGRS